MSRTHGGKGDGRRPILISKEEENLRYELAFRCKDDPKRKRAINRRLKQLEKKV